METLLTGDLVRYAKGAVTITGTYIAERDGMAVIKLKSGYNIGVSPEKLELIERPAPQPPAGAGVVIQNPGLPELAIISTGGTIASRVDYRTGAVMSQFSANDILRAIPELGDLARYRDRQIANILSENMRPALWQDLARAIYEEIRAGAAGVIVTHGTDTMTYSAAAVRFMLKTPVPIVFVGSQRSADRPSSDNAMNALCSAAVATGDLGEVAVVMHATTSDDRCAVHRATRVRKMHTSRRDAFLSIGMEPLGYVDYPSLSVTLSDEAVRRGAENLEIHDALEERCALLHFYPGMPPAVLDAFEGYAGLVISGTGLGHVSTEWIAPLQEMIDGGTTVVMTSQCLHGRVCDRVYNTGRDLLAIGVVEGEDMLPEAALVKLMWVLGNENDPEKARLLMQTDLAGEIRRRSL
ncbi:MULTISPECIES: Glu-tRNA(Gln) amidotransferase subunit GatD [Methanoculleus]|jgi:glutamyl-tRNA(Gln) amidotransferase subunit D|uniref:Glutamyl-tRNA(Gln) amidotransferase subunit D n=1 Tax=Methanoculleus thermophilus TaxID=2200 RepID=A0A1G8XYK8_9EURY|nr:MULTISPECIES: Glu-tRNA(Gln) amidotransferase subunit GatD [Methanoculleus]NLN09324.1 Glu-tRNA(Gln) amidotransferase subunit GatD [Methanoculleus thermophilus]SDJ95613.1 glutamyl-tRNA(Gln) amidotransferase subunit D [Methanoculleus thermophilus]